MPAEPVKNPMSGYCPMAGKYFYPPLDLSGLANVQSLWPQCDHPKVTTIPNTMLCVHVDPSLVYIEIIRIILPRSSHRGFENSGK